jgi:hypothetical protein
VKARQFDHDRTMVAMHRLEAAVAGSLDQDSTGTVDMAGDYQ